MLRCSFVAYLMIGLFFCADAGVPRPEESKEESRAEKTEWVVADLQVQGSTRVVTKSPHCTDLPIYHTLTLSTILLCATRPLDRVVRWQVFRL